MAHQDPRELLVAIATTLKTLGIRYMITGGMAVLVWGRPRFTADIDIVVELRQKNIETLQNALKKLGKKGFIDKETMQEALKAQGEFNFIDGDTGVKVDFWILKKDAFDKSRLARRVRKTVLSKVVYFSSPEDLILIKAIWHKTSESSRQIEDIESIFRISEKRLDIGYIKEWATILEVSDILKIFYYDNQ